MSLFGGGKKDKKGSGGKFAKNANLVEEQLKLAFQQESLANAELRTEVAKLKEALKDETKMRTRLEKDSARLIKDGETMRKLLKGGQEEVMADIDALRKLAEDREAALERARDDAELTKADLERQLADSRTRLEKQAAEITHLIEERNMFELKVSSFQLAKLKQNFAQKKLTDIEEESRAIFHKQLDLLPCHKDLPRLARNIGIKDMDGVVVVKAGEEGATIEETIRALLGSAARRLDGEELAKKLGDEWANHVDDSGKKDLIKSLHAVLKDVLGEQSKVVRMLKAANQSVMAPIVSYLQAGLGEVLPFNSAKNGWKIGVLIGSEQVRVTHKRLECASPDAEAQYGPFQFEWAVDFVLDPDLSQLRSMNVRLLNLEMLDRDASAATASLSGGGGSSSTGGASSTGGSTSSTASTSTTSTSSSSSSSSSSSKKKDREKAHAAVESLLQQSFAALNPDNAKKPSPLDSVAPR